MSRRQPNTDQIKPAYVGARFIKRGDFDVKMLIWWSKNAGYFPTNVLGRGFDGEQRVPPQTVLKALEAHHA